MTEFEETELLSPHFFLKELLKVSNVEYQALNNDNLTHITHDALKVLCNTLLEPIREEFGIVIITSGFRWTGYNHIVGGTVLSQHRFGEAADFYCKYAEIETVLKWIINESNLEFGQLIYEAPVERPHWIHISLGAPYRLFELCGQILKTDDCRTYYKINRNLERIG